MSKGWIGVDLDGTLAYYDGWKGETHIGEPIPMMVRRVKRWLASGKRVKIFTARMSEENEVENVRAAVEAWCLRHLGQMLEVTCCKDFHMIELWDDRCVQVESNTGRKIGD